MVGFGFLMNKLVGFAAFSILADAISTQTKMGLARQPDIVVIGGGSAGLTAAKFGAHFGKEVMLVEKGRLGGDCTWTGCIPSKSLIAAAHRMHVVRNSGGFGIGVEGSFVDWPTLKSRISRTVKYIYDEDDSPSALRKLGINVVEGSASFLDEEGTVLVEDGSTSMVVKPKFGVVLATGAKPASLAKAS
jgi:pyruvate/2-oxoglutarate dehydrogenase complex dihydrolipoamide dehydrogenase (E3) component